MRSFTIFPRKYVRGTTVEASDIIWRSGDGAWYIEEVDIGDGYCLYDIIHHGVRFKTESNFNKAMRTATMYAG